MAAARFSRSADLSSIEIEAQTIEKRNFLELPP